jgi:hypothetical protein
LLLAAGQLPAHASASLLKARENPIDALDRPGPRNRDRAQVLFDGERAEDVALLGCPAEAAPRAQVRWKRRDVLATERNPATKMGGDPDQRIDKGRLADAISSKQRQRPAILEDEADTADDPRLAITRSAAAQPCASSPR